jgi:hypothetical protein
MRSIQPKVNQFHLHCQNGDATAPWLRALAVVAVFQKGRGRELSVTPAAHNLLRSLH